MAKGSFFSRILVRIAKKTSSSYSKSKGIRSSDVINPSSSSPSAMPSTSSTVKSSSIKMKNHITELPMKASGQKQQHVLSLLKYSNSDELALSIDIPPHQIPLFYLRLYIATVQKLKRHHPFSMEKQRAVYHLLSCLVIQQELDRFEPEFEYIGRKPRKTRYISTLLDTPVDSIAPYQHPVLEANKRKPFEETLHVIVPSSSAHITAMPSPSALTRSFSLSSSQSSSYIAPYTPPLISFSPYKQKKINRSDPSLPLIHTYRQIRLSLSDTRLSSLTINDEEDDNMPLAILKTRMPNCLARYNG